MNNQLAQVNIPVPSGLSNFKFLNRPSGQPTPLFGQFSNPNLIADFVSRLLTFAIIGAGLFFFVRLLSAGFSMLTSMGEPPKIQSATKELTNALIGLLIVISSFFLAQIIQVVFGISIL